MEVVAKLDVLPPQQAPRAVAACPRPSSYCIQESTNLAEFLIYQVVAQTVSLARSYRGKGALELHVGLDHAGYFLWFATLTDGRDHDDPVGRGFTFPSGSLVVVGKVYTDHGWYKQLTE